MARPVTEEGDGAPSLRPLYMLLPYLWPKGHPELKIRVVASVACLLLAILATTAFPLFIGSITNQLTHKPPAMIVKLDWWITLATLAMVGLYIWFTFAITRWRIQFRREMNQSDQDANTKAVDSLLNYETVKYFNNEAHETRRFDKSMAKFSRASVQAQTSLSVLNTGQAIIVAAGMGAVMVLTLFGIKQGRFSVGDFVMANAIL